MNIVILVFAILSLNSIRKGTGELIAHNFHQTWWGKLIGTVAGLALGLFYLYYVGYYIMDKNTNMLLATIIALLPFVASTVIKLLSRVHLIEEI